MKSSIFQIQFIFLNYWVTFFLVSLYWSLFYKNVFWHIMENTSGLKRVNPSVGYSYCFSKKGWPHWGVSSPVCVFFLWDYITKIFSGKWFNIQGRTGLKRVDWDLGFWKPLLWRKDTVRTSGKPAKLQGVPEDGQDRTWPGLGLFCPHYP